MGRALVGWRPAVKTLPSASAFDADRAEASRHPFRRGWPAGTPRPQAIDPPRESPQLGWATTSGLHDQPISMNTWEGQFPPAEALNHRHLVGPLLSTAGGISTHFSRHVGPRVQGLEAIGIGILKRQGELRRANPSAPARSERGPDGGAIWSADTCPAWTTGRESRPSTVPWNEPPNPAGGPGVHRGISMSNHRGLDHFQVPC